MSEQGTYRKYIDKRLGDKALHLIGIANQIIDDYQAQGLDLTLRQLYYQFVARDIFANSDRNYDMLGRTINDGRLVGLVNWSAITDRTRSLDGYRTFDGPVQALASLSDTGDEEEHRGADPWLFRRDLWEDQYWRPEVWVEKEALVGVIAGICAQLRVNFFACRGYNSQSEQWRAGRRMAGYTQKGQRPIVFHLGDHDPSGIDMTRDNRERLELFAGTPISIQRLALNMDQVEELNPPPNPAKSTDSRHADYRLLYGDSSWELDALDPSYIRDLIASAVDRIRDETVWQKSLLREVNERERLKALTEDFE